MRSVSLQRQRLGSDGDVDDHAHPSTTTATAHVTLHEQHCCVNLEQKRSDKFIPELQFRTNYAVVKLSVGLKLSADSQQRLGSDGKRLGSDGDVDDRTRPTAAAHVRLHERHCSVNLECNTEENKNGVVTGKRGNGPKS